MSPPMQVMHVGPSGTLSDVTDLTFAVKSLEFEKGKLTLSTDDVTTTAKWVRAFRESFAR